MWGEESGEPGGRAVLNATLALWHQQSTHTKIPVWGACWNCALEKPGVRCVSLSLSAVMCVSGSAGSPSVRGPDLSVLPWQLTGVKSSELFLAQELVDFSSTFLLAIHTEPAE